MAKQQEYKQNARPGTKYNDMPADRNNSRMKENAPSKNSEIAPVQPYSEPVRTVLVRGKNNNKTMPTTTPRQTQQPKIDRQPTNMMKTLEPRKQETARRAPQQQIDRQLKNAAQKMVEPHRQVATPQQNQPQPKSDVQTRLR